MRYVDDICLVCRSEQELNDTEKYLIDYLARWSQGFKAEKTERHSVEDWEPLIEHTRRIKYGRRLDFIEILDLSAEQIESVSQAEHALRDLFLTIESDADVDILVENAGLIFSSLKNSPSSYFTDVAYALLAAYPLKPSTFRVVLSFLLEIELPLVSPRFKQYLTEQRLDSGYSRINLLQVLPYFAPQAGSLRSLLDLYSQDDNYLVRASFYTALKTLAERDGISLTLTDIQQYLAKETSPYVIKRLIDCYAVASGEDVWLPLISLVADEKSDLASSIARAFCSCFDAKRLEGAMLETVFPAFMHLRSLDMSSQIHLLYLTSRHGASWMIRDVFERTKEYNERLAHTIFSITAVETIQLFATSAMLGRLYQFAEIVGQIGFEFEAGLGFEEVNSRTQDLDLKQRARDKEDALQGARLRAGLPDWYATDTTCIRTFYRQQKGNTEYLCLRFSSTTTHREGTLEFISLERILKGGFSSADEWIFFLKHLSHEGLINMIEIGLYTDGGQQSIFCMYEIPPSFKPLADWQQHPNASSLLSVSTVTEIALKLTQAISQTKFNEFHFRSIDPLNIAWSPTGDIKLLNLGSSLGIGSYQCGLPNCRTPIYQEELGVTTASYYLGLLLLQLTGKNCALEAMNSTKIRYGDKVQLHDLVKQLGLSPHLGLTLLRMLRQTPEYRFSSVKWLEQDLLESIAFSQLLSKIPVSNTAKAAHVTLQSFVDFCLKINARNPEIKTYSPIGQVEHVLKHLSQQLKLLPQQTLAEWPVFSQAHKKHSVFPSRTQARMLSPEGRRLLSIAEGWETTFITKDPTQVVPIYFTKLCLYRMLAIEVIACVTAADAAASDMSEQALGEITKLLPQITGELQNKSSIELSIRPLNQPLNVITIPFDIIDLQQLQRFILWLHHKESSRYRIQVESLKAAGLFLVFFGFECEILSETRVVARSKPIVTLNQNKLRGVELWGLLKDLAEFDSQILKAQRSKGNESNDTDESDVLSGETWERAPATIHLIQRLNPAKRYAAELYAYDRLRHEGIIRRIFPHFDELSFAESQVFVCGDTLKPPNAKRPIRVDIWNSHGKETRICSVLAPAIEFKDLPLSVKKISPARLAGWMKRHPSWSKLTLTMIGFGLLPALIALIGLITDTEISTFWAGISGAAGGLCLNLLANSIQAFFATIHPEDAKLAE